MEELDFNLDATSFVEVTNIYEIEFKNLILNLYSCYEYMIADKVKVPRNDENKIRDILYSYIAQSKIRNEICNIYGFRLDKEVDEKTGRVDLKVIDINDFENFNAYYVLECKRIDGKSTLNNEYVKNGINRFTTGYYSSYYGISGMIAFIVDKIDIDKNIIKIGSFFNTIKNSKLYDSSHDSVKLYHLMMDFSNNLK